MNRRVRIAVKAADIVKFDADVIALKFQGPLSGATRHVALALNLSATQLQDELPSEGMAFVAPGEGRIGARHAMFLRVPPVSSFTYQHVRLFNTAVLRALRERLPETKHLAVTMHGVGYDIDLEDSLSAIVRGCGDAIRAGDIPDRFQTVTIVARQFDEPDVVNRIMKDLVPAGGLEAPMPPAAAAIGDPSLYDIFISYKSDDESTARQVYDALSRNGLRVFFSRTSLPQLGSSEYHQQIDKALERARHMVVVTTSNDRVMARWVQYEWRAFMGEQLAGRKTGNLITMLGGDMRIEDLPISLRHKEVLRCDEEGLEALIQFTRRDVDGIGTIPLASYDRLAPPAEPPPAAPSTVTVAGDLIVAVTNVLWNTSWQDALEHLMLSRELDASQGWRMPTLDELRLIQQRGVLPEDSCYWSSEEAGKKEAHYMHFDDGHVGQGPKSFSHGVSAVFVKSSQPPQRS